MSTPEFQNLPLYTYLGGQVNLIQYATTISSNGIAAGYNERFVYSYTSPSSYQCQFEDSVDITPADFANTSMLARDMKNSLGKTLAVFTSLQVTNISTSGQYQGACIDSSVGLYQNGNPLVDIQTYSESGGTSVTASAASFSLVTITSFLNNLRT